MFSTIKKCSKCGSAMISEIYYGSQGYSHVRYVCPKCVNLKESEENKGNEINNQQRNFIRKR